MFAATSIKCSRDQKARCNKWVKFPNFGGEEFEGIGSVEWVENCKIPFL